MNRQDIVRRYINTISDDFSQALAVQELMLEMVPTDFHDKCNACRLCEESYAPVSGVGNVSAEVVFIGRNPGTEEDNKGIPFIGDGGRLLDSFIGWCGLDRDNIYITNLVKCFSKGNRIPKVDEIIACTDTWLKRELKLLKPKIIVTLGQEACLAMTGSELKVMRLNAITYDSRAENLEGVVVLAATHPGAPLHAPRMMKNFKDDAAYLRAICTQNGVQVKEER